MAAVSKGSDCVSFDWEAVAVRKDWDHLSVAQHTVEQPSVAAKFSTDSTLAS